MGKQYVSLPDGRRIHVVPQRGQLFVCALGCCCGHTERDFTPVPTDLYHTEWERRRLRNKVHLTFTACLGPCSLSNVVLLLFGGQATWFHSLNSEVLVLAIYNYIEEMLKASRYLPPPAPLAEHVFPGFFLNTSQERGTLPVVS
jgi:cobaltochelatase CobN